MQKEQKQNSKQGRNSVLFSVMLVNTFIFCNESFLASLKKKKKNTDFLVYVFTSLRRIQINDLHELGRGEHVTAGNKTNTSLQNRNETNRITMEETKKQGAPS